MSDLTLDIRSPLPNHPEAEIERPLHRLRAGARLLTPEEKRRAGLLVVLSLMGALLQTLTLVSIVPVLMLILSDSSAVLDRIPASVATFFGIADKKDVIRLLGPALAVLVVGNAIYAWALAGATARFTMRCQTRVSGWLMNRVLRAEYRNLLSQNSTYMLQIITAFVPHWANQFVGQSVKIAGDLCLFLFLVATMIVASPLMGLSLFAAATLFGFVLFNFMRRKRLGFSITARNASLRSKRICAEAIFGAKEIKLAGQEGRVSDLFSEQIIMGADAATRDVQFSMLPRLLIEGMVLLLLVLVSTIVVLSDLPASEYSAVLFLYGLAALRLAPMSSGLVSSLTGIVAVLPTIDNLSKLIRETAPPEAAAPREESRHAWRTIELREIGFNYAASDREVVRQITLDIVRGHSYGLIGQSGSGKSTLVDLIVGLLRPSSGQVRLDGQGPVDLAADSWKRRFGYVAQRPFILDASLRDNITFAFGGPIDEERLAQVVKLACLEGVVANLPDGLSSGLGDQGGRLSGGERQRVAIARALYRGAEVLILDEATSSLDTINEREIARALAQLRGVITTIIVSHRLELVQGCDEIWLLAGGELVARGPHALLQDSSNLYRRMLGAGSAELSEQAPRAS